MKSMKKNNIMAQETIQLKIPNSRQKLISQFPIDPRGDVNLKFKSKEFKLQKAFLRLQSAYFKKKFTLQQNFLQIYQSFNIVPQYIQEEYFSSVLSCFYGNQIHVPRSQVLLYYPIIKFLQVDTLLTELRKDMVKRIENYDLFMLMRMAHQYNEQQCFQSCLKQLQKQGFQQMNYNNSDLLSCSVELFKLIIKTHNRRRSQGGKGLQYKQIDNFIKQYTEANKLGQDRYSEYKFQLIDKTRLTAKEYKQIFMDELPKPRQFPQSFSKISEIGFKCAESTNIMNSTSKQMFESMIKPLQKAYSNELALEMENTFHKKQNKELKQEKQRLLVQVDELKNSTKSNQQVNQRLQVQLADLRAKLKLKQKAQGQQRATLGKFQEKVKSISNSLNDKYMSMRKLESKVQELCKIISNKDNRFKEEEETTYVQSQIIPANLIGNIMKKQPTVQNKQNEKKSQLDVNKGLLLKSLDEDEIQQSYQSRLSFDIEPISTPKMYIPILVEFMVNDGFTQNKLKLIYRRSDKYPEIGNQNQLRNRKSMIMLVRTCKGQNIGGYISVTIPENSSNYVQDRKAYIFSLSRGYKFMVKNLNQSQAIFLNQHYIIGFGNDLFISKDVLNEQSYCDWPSAYDKGKLEQHGPEWFAGGHQFRVKDIQFYEINEEDMIMTLG